MILIMCRDFISNFAFEDLASELLICERFSLIHMLHTVHGVT